METRKCKHCGLEFEMPGRVFSNHVRWCDKNPSRNKTKNISVGILSSYDRKYGEISDFDVECCKCGKKITVQEREKQFPKKDKYFCSRSCSNSHVVTEDHRQKTSKALSGRQISPREKRRCLECNKYFSVISTSNQKFCSFQCSNHYRKSDNALLRYRSECNFKFNVWQYPDEFDLSLIYNFGWYKAANRGNNLNGVSRDHKISIMYGWENGISPDIMSHPANCQLMRHSENISKNSNCSVTIEELLLKISEWDKKYDN